MHIVLRDELAAQLIADLRRQAAKHRLLRQLRTRRKQTLRRRRRWEPMTPRRPRPAVSTATPMADTPAMADSPQPAARRAG